MNKGDRVKIQNTTLNGELVDEGEATLLRHDEAYFDMNGFERWVVKFEIDAQECSRWVTPSDLL